MTENLQESKYHKLDHICSCSGIFLIDQCLSHLVNHILESLSLNETSNLEVLSTTWPPSLVRRRMDASISSLSKLSLVEGKEPNTTRMASWGRVLL